MHNWEVRRGTLRGCLPVRGDVTGAPARETPNRPECASSNRSENSKRGSRRLRNSARLRDVKGDPALLGNFVYTEISWPSPATTCVIGRVRGQTVAAPAQTKMRLPSQTARTKSTQPVVDVHPRATPLYGDASWMA